MNMKINSIKQLFSIFKSNKNVPVKTSKPKLFNGVIPKLHTGPEKDCFQASAKDVKLVHARQLMEGDVYNIVSNGKAIGELYYEPQCIFCDKLQTIFPKHFFDENGKIKPILSIDFIEIFDNKNQRKGIGRKVMQQLFQKSLELGCEGRITLESLPFAKGFYSKLGFDIPVAKKATYDAIYKKCEKIAKCADMSPEEFKELLERNSCPNKLNGKFNADGIRFFDPTDENIKLLYKN